MVRQDVVEGDVLDDGGAVEDQLDVVGAVEGGGVPEVEQGLLVLVHRDTGLAQLGMEKGPQVLEIIKVTSLFAKTCFITWKTGPSNIFSCRDSSKCVIT